MLGPMGSSFAFVLLALALVAFALGSSALVDARDVAAFFWLATGAVATHASTRMAALPVRRKA